MKRLKKIRGTQIETSKQQAEHCPVIHLNPFQLLRQLQQLQAKQQDLYSALKSRAWKMEAKYLEKANFQSEEEEEKEKKLEPDQQQQEKFADKGTVLSR